MLCSARIDARKDHGVECQIPGRVPGVFPLVGHDNHVSVVKVTPLVIAAGLTRRRRRWLTRVAVEPGPDVVVVELLAPDHACKALAHHRGFVLARVLGAKLRVVLVSLALAVSERALKACAEV